MLNHRTTLILSLLICFGMCLIPSILVSSTIKPPASDKKPVTDIYHDVKIVDNYRWLEDFSDPKVQEWTEQQNNYTRLILDTVTNRELIEERLAELLGQVSPQYGNFQQKGEYYFALKMLPPAQHYYLVRYSSLNDLTTEKILINVDEIDKEHLTEIEYYTPSPNGKLVAVSLSRKGSESGNMYVFDSETGGKLNEFVPRVNEATASGDVSWKKDGSGFYYTRYPHKGERPDEDLLFYQQVYYHQLGTSFEQDRYITGKQFPKVAEIELEMSDDYKQMMITVENGDGGEFEHFLMDENENITQITQLDDLIPAVTFGYDNCIYLLSFKTASNGEILYLPPGETDITNASVIVEESDVCIKSIYPCETKLYIRDMAGGPTRLRVLDLKTNEQIIIPSNPISSLGYLSILENDNLFFRSTSYLTPPAFYIYDPVTNSISSTPFVSTSPADFSEFEVCRDYAISKDGTKIPVNIIRNKSIELDGNNPTILNGYGGYSISLSPYFDAKLRFWLEQGGVYVIANLRGGGEYGKNWHLAGNLTNKQNVFDDFEACAKYLIEKGYTSPEKLVISGKSNGGLLMGAAMTQYPELFKVVISEVGIYDMLRVELDPNGVFNITEFGTVKDPDQFNALYAYSPYHNVKSGVTYPSVLFTAANYDNRVNPMQSRKMTALLQNVTCSNNPILLRTNYKGGHGRGSLDQKINLFTDIYSFIFSQLGMTYKYDK